MMRFRLFLTGAMLMAGVMLMVYAQDNTQATLTPDKCTITTCFMGLRPGESTVQQVMNTIGSSAWVSDWSWFENSPGFGGFGWKWSDKAPAILRQVDYPGGEIAFNKGVVTDIWVATKISPDFLVFLVGQPERYGVMNTLGGWDTPVGVGITFVMPDEPFWFISVIGCPFYPHIWNGTNSTAIHWGNVDDVYPASWNNLTAEDFMNEIQSEQSMCH